MPTVVFKIFAGQGTGQTLGSIKICFFLLVLTFYFTLLNQSFFIKILK